MDHIVSFSFSLLFVVVVVKYCCGNSNKKLTIETWRLSPFEVFLCKEDLDSNHQVPSLLHQLMLPENPIQLNFLEMET